MLNEIITVYTVYMAVDDTSSLPVERLRNVPHVQVAFTQPTWHGQ